mgnify:CR=1 FL=1|nr:MATE family efflux transporter [uncultured Mediterraneibacter sp.]
MEQTYMKEQPVLKLLLTMALPMVISMLVNALYNIVDSFFVAKISEDAMTALSLVYPMQNLINAVMIGFGIGINSVISFYLGAQDQEKADKAAAQGLILSTIHGIILMVICIVGANPFLRFFTENETVLDMGMRYSRIVFLFSVVLAWHLVLEKTFQAVGMMAVSMICMMGGCIFNIILDPLLIFGVGFFPALGIEGAALATGLGQAIGLVMYLAFYKLRSMPVHFRKKHMHLEKELCKKMYSIGIPACLSMALPSLLISSLNVILAAFGQTYVFVLGVYYKLQTFLYLTANGVIQGMRPLIGYNYGAGEKKRVHKIYTTSLSLVLIVMAVGTVICLMIPNHLIGMFTTGETTVKAGAEALRIISAGFIISSVSIVTCGALEGLGKGKESLMISLCRYVLIIIPAAWIVSRIVGVTGVWHGFWIAEVLTAGISLIIYKKAVRI